MPKKLIEDDYRAKARSMYEQTNGVLSVTSGGTLVAEESGAYVSAQIWIERDHHVAKLHALREGLMLAHKMAVALDYKIIANDVGIHLSELERTLDKKMRRKT